MNAMAALHLQVISGPVIVPLTHEQRAFDVAYRQRLVLDRTERHAADVGRALDLKLMEKALHAGSCSWCHAHRRGTCPRRREVERAVRSLRRRYGRAMTLLGGA